MAGEVEMSLPSTKSFDIDKLRTKVKSYIDIHQYQSALYWADKAVSLSKGESSDLYWLAHTLHLTGQYHRAAHLLKQHKLDKKYLGGRYLAAQCHYECKEYSEAIDILGHQSGESIMLDGKTTEIKEETDPSIPSDKMESCIHLLRGHIYEALENRQIATECYSEALRTDVYCYEAFECLVNHHMMTAQEEKELLESLPYSQQCSDEEVELLRFLYENKLKKYNRPSELRIPSSLDTLQSNLDVTVNLAERHYYNCDFRGCYAITSKVLSQDPYNEHCLPLHISVLVELKKPNDLFYLAHKLVDMYPTKAVSWFAVGCYYLLVGKNEHARRYLSKATNLDRSFGPAWLAFGHSFATENEHDQAMAAYFTASQIMRGCHLPVLYIGLEYGVTNNAKLAERFFSQALSIAPEDPFVLHEMGTVAFQNLDYEQAEKYFRSALEMIQSTGKEIVADKWEPLLNNLGHVCRKLKKYEEALEYHRQALILCPQNPSTFSAMGYVYALTGECMEAVDYFHKALGIRRDDTFSTTMLGYAIDQLMLEMTPCSQMLDMPDRPFSETLETMKVKDTSSAADDTQLSCDSHTNLSCDSSHNSLQHTSLEGEISMADSSNMAIDTDMEDT